MITIRQAYYLPEGRMSAHRPLRSTKVEAGATTGNACGTDVAQRSGCQVERARRHTGELGFTAPRPNRRASTNLTEIRCATWIFNRAAIDESFQLVLKPAILSRLQLRQSTNWPYVTVLPPLPFQPAGGNPTGLSTLHYARTTKPQPGSTDLCGSRGTTSRTTPDVLDPLAEVR